MSTIRAKLVFLGGSRGQSGCAEQSLVLESPATVADVAHWVEHNHPALSKRLGTVRWARNHEFASLDDVINDGDEVALIPPVAGGAPSNPRAIIQSAPIDIAFVLSQVSGPEIGAVVSFIGSVRNHSRGQAVTSLDYEAYEPMTSRVLTRIVDDLEAANDRVAIAVTHRTGQLDVGQHSVVIAVASPHREAAYAVCREALEKIKQDLPIWKRETTTEGEQWIGWGGG